MPTCERVAQGRTARSTPQNHNVKVLASHYNDINSFFLVWGITLPWAAA